MTSTAHGGGKRRAGIFCHRGGVFSQRGHYFRVGLRRDREDVPCVFLVTSGYWSFGFWRQCRRSLWQRRRLFKLWQRAERNHILPKRKKIYSISGISLSLTRTPHRILMAPNPPRPHASPRAFGFLSATGPGDKDKSSRSALTQSTRIRADKPHRIQSRQPPT